MLSIAIQMDPIENVDITADSTFRIALEAQKRGHRLFTYHPFDMTWQNGSVFAKGRRITVRNKQGDHVTFNDWEIVNLADWNVILLRQDPPFDMSYITNTHLLEEIHPNTLVANDPFWVRNYPEKLLVTQFQDLTPPTMITRDLDQIKEFRSIHGDIILKPLYGNGGAGVFKLRIDDPNLSSLHEMFTEKSREPIIAQQFLPDVSAGDKRVILVDGEPIGAINRVPEKGEARSNMHVGGKPEPIELDERDIEICKKIGPLLKEKGQIFVGIDVIGGMLTEINVTSPTGIQELERFTGINTAEKIWQVIESKKGL